MQRKINIQSLAEFKSRSGSVSVAEKREMTDGQNSSVQIDSLSPIKNGKSAQISCFSRNNVLNFAHPVDAAIIKALDNPAVNAVFNKVVQTSIDASWGLALATGIHIGPNTYPQLYQTVAECADALGIPIPYVIISDQIKGINACTAGTNQFSFIAISSMLPLVMNTDEIKFVIGHECGHLALGHVVYHTAVSMAGTATGMIPLVGDVISKTITYPLNAWSRRSEISADRAGLICCRDIGIAAKTLLKLEAGLLNVDEIDIDAYVAESENVLHNSMLGKFGEYAMSHPIIPKRIRALKLFGESEVYASSMGIAATDRTLLPREVLAEETEKIIEIM